MKTSIKTLLAVILVSISLPARAQLTNIISGPILDIFSQGSNWVVAPYFIYNQTTEKVGAGLGFGYKATPYLVPTVRFDIINDDVFVPQLNLTLQAPINFFKSDTKPNGIFTLTPFTSSGIATSFNDSQDGPIGVFAVGAYIRINKSTGKWWMPSYLLGDFERWTGSGFNDNMIRGGLGWPLGWN